MRYVTVLFLSFFFAATAFAQSPDEASFPSEVEVNLVTLHTPDYDRHWGAGLNAAVNAQVTGPLHAFVMAQAFFPTETRLSGHGIDLVPGLMARFQVQGVSLHARTGLGGYRHVFTYDRYSGIDLLEDEMSQQTVVNPPAEDALGLIAMGGVGGSVLVTDRWGVALDTNLAYLFGGSGGSGFSVWNRIGVQIYL